MLTWADFGNTATQLAVLVAATGLLYRVGRLVWPDIPEAIVQVIAAVLSSVLTLAVIYKPELPTYQWLVVGIASGVLTSMQVIKLLDWGAAAMTKTGAPEAGIPEKPPAWFIAELAKGATVESPVPVQVRSLATLAAQQQTNDEAVAKAAPVVTRAFVDVRAKAEAQAKKDAAAVTPLRVPEPPAAAEPAVLPTPRVPRERDLT